MRVEHCGRLGLSRLEVLVVVSIVGLLIALLLPAVQSARQAARQSQSRNNLKQLGLAFHNYHDVWKSLPPGGYLKADGRDGHGWFAMELPYMDGSPLYNWIDFDRPWTDPFNRHHFRTGCPIAHIPGVDHIATTQGYSLLHYPANPSVLHLNSSITIPDFRGGTSHAWLLGEAVGNHRPWGSPFNWRAWDQPLNSDDDAFGAWEGATNFLLADGSVRLISNDAAEEVRASLDGGLPEPDPANLRQPSRHWEYRIENQGRARSRVVELDDQGWHGLALVIEYENDGHAEAAVVRPAGKGSNREPDLSDLRQVVENCPNVRMLRIRIEIDEQASLLIARLPRLESLAISTVIPTPQVVADLQSLPHLQELLIETSLADTQQTLQGALPDVAVHVRRALPDPVDRDETK